MLYVWFTVVSRMVIFPDRTFPGKTFPGWSFSRMRQFLMINLYTGRTLNMNNTLYKFIPRRKANWLTLLSPHRYAKCQMLIFHHSSKTNELRNVQGSIKTASVSTFLSWPSLQIPCVVLVAATCYVLQLAPPKLNRLNRYNAITMTTAS